MPARITVVNMYTKRDAGPDGLVVDTTSRAGWSSDLSPFKLGPVHLYGGWAAANMENAWQFAKVYARHVGEDGNPTSQYLYWAREGWADPKPHRYPMGRGAVPEYSWWEFGGVHEPMGRRLGYIEARKVIYGPLYIQAVVRTQGWRTLLYFYRTKSHIILRDYDGYDHDAAGVSLSHVLNDPRRKMGHAFVLKMLLTWDVEALSQMWLPPTIDWTGYLRSGPSDAILGCGCCRGPEDDRCCCQMHQDPTRGLLPHTCSRHS